MRSNFFFCFTLGVVYTPAIRHCVVVAGAWDDFAGVIARQIELYELRGV